MSGRSTPVQATRVRTGTRELTPFPVSSPGAVDYWGARTNNQQSIANTGVPAFTNWDEFVAIGDGENWAYDPVNGKLTVPPGAYQIVGGGTWSALGFNVVYGCQVANQMTVLPFDVTGIFIGQQGVVPAAGTLTSPNVSFAGFDFYDVEMTLQFLVFHRHTGVRNFDRAHWGVWRLGDAPPPSCL